MSLYHFTDSGNIRSIRRRGLLSWRRLEDLQVFHRAGSNELSRRLDKLEGLEDYVRLCREPTHPMAFVALDEGRIDEVLWLVVDEQVLRFSPLYSDMNATATAAIVNRDPATAFESQDPQAEILIPGFVAAKWITFPT